MLPRDERLPTAEFTQVWEHGVHLRHPLFSVRAALREEGCDGQGIGPARCAFVVSRKSGKATVRNRIRRRVRECYRLSEARKHDVLRGYSVIFLINATRADAPPCEWTRAFTEIAPRIVRDVKSRRARVRDLRAPVALRSAVAEDGSLGAEARPHGNSVAPESDVAMTPAAEQGTELGAEKVAGNGNATEGGME